ncbi:MAG: histidine--tRNA ligase [Clostridia bacterium]|nr:histidine--tRNA ligase [Clostridia bacterium]
MITKGPRGTADILPSDIEKWQFIENTAKETAKTFGFKEIRTPVFEHTELFQRGVGDTTDVVQKEMYTFNDKADRSITLRPEGTASVARSYLEHSLYALPAPVKLFYNITCYRYEKPQAGRMREFHQFGAEAYGLDTPAVDAEIIAFASTLFKNLGIKDLELNINSIGCKECRANYNKALIEYLKAHSDKLCGTCHERLEKNPMRVLDCKNPECKVAAANAPSILDHICDGCREHFEETKKHLDNFGIKYNIDPSIVRGLDYYTRTVFEFVSHSIGAQGTVCGGGRYDGLIEELGGTPTPGIGFATGLERILLVMEAQNVKFPTESVPEIYIASLGQETAVMSLCYELRQQGIWAECDLAGKSLKAQMKNADRSQAKYSIVIGDNEVETNSANIKDMTTGEKEEIKIDCASVAAFLRGEVLK